jgi:glutathione S-transferase
MPAKLYAVPASHPCAAVEAALQRKGVGYERVDLVPVAHVAHQLAVFGRRTVPGVRFADGTKLQGSRAIVRELERRVPEPALFPSEPAARRRVEIAEEWGDQVLQPIVRRVIWAALRRSPGAGGSYATGARLPVPPALRRATMPAIALLESALNGSSDANVRADLVNLPDHLERIEDWMAAGVLGGAELNAADAQIGAGLALLATIEDLKPALDRPAATLPARWFADYPGHTPAGALPAAWLPA